MARFSAGKAANLAAWGVLFALIAFACVLVMYLGPFGLLLLGLITLLICSQFNLDEHAPTWGAQVFRARMQGARSPEEQAAEAEQRRWAMAPIGFYKGCGAVLVVAGLAGLAWQTWR